MKLAMHLKRYVKSKVIYDYFKIKGIKFYLGHKVVGGSTTTSKVIVNVESIKDKKTSNMDADVVLVATGRSPHTTNLGLGNIGIHTDKVGKIPVNGKLQTKVEHIYAVGDVIEGPMLAHKGEEEGIAAVEMICGLPGHVNYQSIPNVVYTWPEIASVGWTEEECTKNGIKFLLNIGIIISKGVFPFMANSRARTNEDFEGFVKVVTDKITDKILGVHIIGPNAGEMIAECVLGVEYGASSEDLARTCHAHPTLSEAIKEACLAAHDKPIHF